MLNITGGNMSSGYRKYLHHVVPRLREHPAVTDLFVSIPPLAHRMNGFDDSVHEWQPGEQWRGFPLLQRTVREWNPDVVFIPTARIIDCGAPCVSMLRNMELMTTASLREGVREFSKLILRRQLARYSVRRASRVIAVSDFVRECLRTRWHVPDDRTAVVYHGVDVATQISEAPAAVRSLSNTPFVFAPGSLLPYRGLQDAISALRYVRSEHIQLVIAGTGLHSYRARLESLARTTGVAERVRWVGQLDESSMAWAYQHCDAFVMTSRVEACPNTVLEALSNGCVCISTRCQPMPEFLGDVALYYETGDAEALAQQIDRAVKMKPDDRQSLASRGRLLASRFSWDNTVNQTVSQLQLAIEQST